MGCKSINFLGTRIESPNITRAAAKHELEQKLESMLQAVNKTALTSQQKLKIYREGICPRLNLLLITYEYPITWIEKLDALAIEYLKRWAGLAQSANPNVLFLPTRKGGLNLPSISTFYKNCQVMRQCQLVTSADPTVRHITEAGLQAELVSKLAKEISPNTNRPYRRIWNIQGRHCQQQPNWQ